MTRRLFVVHQDADIATISAACKAGDEAVIVTTHRPFPHEREQLTRVASRVQLTHFGELMTDAELAACDDQASTETRARLGERTVRDAYSAAFMTRSIDLKNAAAHRKLGDFDAMYFTRGLGVSERYWATRATAIDSTQLDAKAPGLVDVAVRALSDRPTFTIVDDQYVFVGNVKRLHLVEGTRVETMRSRIPWAAMSRAPSIAGRLLQRELGLSGTIQLATTIHEYRAATSQLADAWDSDLAIFVDGHHPSNYPRSYLDMYLSGHFVVASHLSSGWFTTHGRTVERPAAFQRSELFAPCVERDVSSVLLVMNHAGDWTSLINRADSDILIEAFATLASAHPALSFVLRLHPTMTGDSHEGPHSASRVRNWIASLGLPNLHVSDATLAEDLARAQLYLSEYSQVLIDAWQQGHLGVAVNLTNRRSFMADYEAFGFPGVSSIEALDQILRDLPRSARVLTEQQAAAVDKFNDAQRDWERQPRFRASTTLSR